MAAACETGPSSSTAQPPFTSPAGSQPGSLEQVGFFQAPGVLSAPARLLRASIAGQRAEPAAQPWLFAHLAVAAERRRICTQQFPGLDQQRQTLLCLGPIPARQLAAVALAEQLQRRPAATGRGSGRELLSLRFRSSFSRAGVLDSD